MKKKFSVGAFGYCAWLIMTSATAAAQEADPKAPSAETAISIETFAAPPSIEDPELSPNGEWVAARISVGERQMLAMSPLFDTAAKPTLIGLSSEKVSVDGWRWVNDDWLLVWLSANDSVEGEKWRVSRVISIERATGKTHQLGWKHAGQNASDVIWVANDGSPRILLGIQNSIYSNLDEFWPEVRAFDVSTGKSKSVQSRRTDMMDYYADSSGTIRLGYGYSSDTRVARLIYRASEKDSFKTLDRANLKKDEKLAFPSVFLPEPGKAITTDDSDGYDALYELDLATLQRGKKIFGLDGYDIDGFVRNATDDGLAGIRYTKDHAIVHWLDPHLAKTQSEMDKAVGASRASVVSWDKSRKKLLVQVGGPDQAGAFFYYDTAKSGTMSRIAFASTKLKARKLAPVSTFRYKARDGLEIPAVLTLPKGKPAKSLPVILLPHGGPQARDSERWDWMTQFLAWRGYAVVQPNFRGSAGFGTKFLEAGEGQWGLKMQDDLNDAVAHLATQGIIDPKRVCIMGASYGGYAAMRGAQRDGGKFRCAISYAGVSDLAQMSRYDGRFLYGKEYRQHLKEQAPDYAAVSPVNFATQFSAPILIMHGKLDLRVPVEQSRRLAQKLKDAGKAYRYVEQPLGDHHFTRTEDRLTFLKEVDAYLLQYNPAN